MLPSDHLGPQQIQQTTLAQAYMRLPDSSIHRISILFHTLYNKQRKVTDSPQNTVIRQREDLGWFSLPF